MRRLLFWVFAMCIAAQARADYEFMLGRWESDAELGLKRSGYLDGLNIQQKKELIEQWPRITWRIDRAELRYEDESGNVLVSPYFVRPVDEDTFELVISHGKGDPDIATIEKTDFGFCATFTFDHLKLDREINDLVDCFKRAGT